MKNFIDNGNGTCDLMLLITGQCPSGKNAVIVTRTGHRFPAKRFVEWRKKAMEELAPQLAQIKKKYSLPIKFPVSVEFWYTPSDKRRRDAPGIIDAIWHLLEKIGLVSDDTFLAGHDCSLSYSSGVINKALCGVQIFLRDLELK